MGRPRVDAEWVALARQRTDSTTEHFGVSMRRRAGTPAGPCRLGMSVPKRLLPLAVDRNALKRVAREAWRLAEWPAELRPERAMIKLRRRDDRWRELPRGALKRLWRAELDRLIGRARSRLSP
jgi:RNase P protein component